MKLPEFEYKYGIVIDSGSSGSRVYVYRWKNPKKIQQRGGNEIDLKSPPQIVLEEHWTKKTTPGLAKFNSGKKRKAIWSQHYEGLMEFAAKIIPKEQHSETPLFVLATAGMRLLLPKEQKAVLKEVCNSMKTNTDFFIGNCKDHVEIIDGETEGIYGWLGLNYLMGQFNNFDSSVKEHESIGFLDMGGASTQIAFVPSTDEERKKHKEDLSQVTIRNVNGDTQKWDLFVETWLGFGANEARKRYLNQLINLSQINPSIGNVINDPCSPNGAEIAYEYDGKSYNIKGIGNYEMCVKTVYPLLLKNVPCIDTPCLFNGVHGPKLNFEKDRFIGISEYWYTANDVFQSGGEYNFRTFNEKVKQYCESDWSTILKNSEKGQYSGLDPDKFLKDACFKASWVINVLHDGFELPRLDIETPESDPEEQNDELITDKHIPFKSTNSINGNELSWTLGKILLYASSQAPTIGKDVPNIGIYPSEISEKKFIPASGPKNNKDEDTGFGILIPFFVFALIAFGIYYLGKHNVFKHRYFNGIKKRVLQYSLKTPLVNQIWDAESRYNQINDVEMSLNLEEGTLTSSHSSPNLAQLRTRSTNNLNEPNTSEPRNDDNNNSSSNNFINKPFVIPKRNQVYFYSQNNSRESLHRSLSNLSPKPAKSKE